MDTLNLAIGDNVLIQSARSIKERAIITGFTFDNAVIVRTTDDRRKKVAPESIIKKF